jgi:hypothetical protein
VSDAERGEHTLLYTYREGMPPVPVPESLVWALLEALAILGEAHTVRVAQLGAEIAFGLMGMPDGAKKTQETAAVVRDMLDGLSRRVLGGEWATPEERTIVLCYRLMQQKAITSWPDAAAFATRALGREVSPGAWRKRLERWAGTTGRPPIEIYKRKQE